MNTNQRMRVCVNPEEKYRWTKRSGYNCKRNSDLKETTRLVILIHKYPHSYGHRNYLRDLYYEKCRGNQRKSKLTHGGRKITFQCLAKFGTEAFFTLVLS